jgi:hypothetical protein
VDGTCSGDAAIPFVGRADQGGLVHEGNAELAMPQQVARIVAERLSDGERLAKLHARVVEAFSCNRNTTQLLAGSGEVRLPVGVASNPWPREPGGS